ncbi:DNA polymerase V [Mucilaginibacter sp. UYP25]|uniref:LexA family protein n=1 Tax=unclassified Mucilaginibacter TaxID=2617802 RepID=UPI003399A5EA
MKNFAVDYTQSLKRPLAGWVIHAAFESPATDYEEDRISLDQYVSTHPEAVFYIRVTGDCMIGSGINDGDLLVVDRSIKPLTGDVIIGVLNGEHIITCYVEYNGANYLVPDNPAYEVIKVEEFTTFTIEGVVPHTLLNQRKQAYVRANRLQQLLCKLRTGIST